MGQSRTLNELARFDSVKNDNNVEAVCTGLYRKNRATLCCNMRWCGQALMHLLDSVNMSGQVTNCDTAFAASDKLCFKVTFGHHSSTPTVAFDWQGMTSF